MLKRSNVLRPARFRALAVSGIVLGSLVAAGNATMAAAADAATMAPAHAAVTRAAACAEAGPFYFPQGDALLMTQYSNGFRVLVVAELIASYPTPVGYVYAWGAFPGQPFKLIMNSPLNSEYPVEVSSFAIGLGYDFLTRQWTPDLVYNPCTWKAVFGPESSI